MQKKKVPKIQGASPPGTFMKVIYTDFKWEPVLTGKGISVEGGKSPWHKENLGQLLMQTYSYSKKKWPKSLRKAMKLKERQGWKRASGSCNLTFHLGQWSPPQSNLNIPWNSEISFSLFNSVFLYSNQVIPIKENYDSDTPKHGKT